MVAAGGADKLKNLGVTALEAAVHDPDRLAPKKRCRSVAGLTSNRICHNTVGLDAQPQVTVIVRARGGDGGRTERRVGTGHDVRISGAAHSTHHQPLVPVCRGSEAELCCQMVHARRRTVAFPAELDSA